MSGEFGIKVQVVQSKRRREKVVIQLFTLLRDNKVRINFTDDMTRLITRLKNYNVIFIGNCSIKKEEARDKRWEDKDETRRVKIFRQWSGRDCFTYVQIDFLALAQTGFDIDRRRSQTLWYRAVVQYKWATKDNIITLFAPFFYMRHDLLPTLCLQAQIHVHKQKKEEENVSQGWRKVCIIIFSSYFTPKLTWWCNPYLEDSLHLVVVLPFASKLLH